MKTKMSRFLTVFFLACGFLLFFANDSLGESGSTTYSILDSGCSNVLLDPTNSFGNIGNKEIKKLQGDYFCLKIENENGENEGTFFVALNRNWLEENKIENVKIGKDAGEVSKDGAIAFQFSDEGGQIFFEIEAVESVGGGTADIKKIIQNVTEASTVTSSSLILLILLRLIFEVQSFSQLRGLFVNLLAVLLFWRKGRHVAGVIYDAKSGAPVSLATVSIIDADSGKVKEVKTTDRNGAYFFLASPGRYLIRASRKGYRIPAKSEGNSLTTVYEPIYFEEDIVEAKGENTLIEKAIPLLGEDENIPFKIKLSRFFNKLFRSIFLEVFFWIGLAMSFFTLLFKPSGFNLLVVLFYLALFLMQKANFRKANWGVVTNTQQNPEPFSFVNVNDPQRGFSARTITDEKGRYAFILDEGSYDFKVRGVKGGQGEERLELKKKKLIGKDIELGGL